MRATPAQKVADKVEPVDEKRRRDQEKEDNQDQPAIKRKWPELTLVFVTGMTKPRATV